MHRRTDRFYQHEYQDGESKNGVCMMNGKIAVRHAAAAVLMISIAAGAYLFGYKTAYDRIENAAGSYGAETFYAVITDISDSSITVQGMEINDINFRGRFTFPVMEETSYLWRGTRISPKDLEEGDNISITFTGLVQETSPAGIQEVLKVQLLDDDFEG